MPLSISKECRERQSKGGPLVFREAATSSLLALSKLNPPVS